ncbi:MAG: redox-sensing transcriptional repressor Rex [Anaerolineales bacterium]
MTTFSAPDIVIGRLPLYLRALSEMQSRGVEITSSQDLGNRLGISSAQIRKDLSQFGEFGKQGTGYSVDYLADQLKRILNVNQIWDVVLVGAGDLGTAVANYGGFVNRGFRVAAVYDSAPQKIGQQVGEFTIRSVMQLKEDIENEGYRIAMLAVPASSAQKVSEQLVEAGIQAILCYAPTSLSLPESIRVQHIDPVLHLQRMTYYLP